MVRLRLGWATSNFCAAALMLPQSTTVTKYSRLLRCILCFLSCARSKTDTDPCRKPVLCRNTDRKPDSCIPCAGGSSAGDTKGPQKRTLARAAASGAVFVKELSRPGRGYSPTARSARRPGLKKTGMVHSSVAGQQQKGCPPDLSLGRQWNVSPPNTPENTQQPALNASERATGRLVLSLLCDAVCLFSKFRSTKRQNVDCC